MEIDMVQFQHWDPENGLSVHDLVDGVLVERPKPTEHECLACHAVHPFSEGSLCRPCVESIDEVDKIMMGYTVGLIAALHQLPNCSMGGPLHVVTDDQNIDDDTLDWCLANMDEW